jgi:hypothetical protein
LAIDEMLELNAAMSSVTRLKQARKPFLVDMKHFSGVLASGHLLDRLLRVASTLGRRRCSQACVSASTPASNAACVANHWSALRAKISATGSFNGISDVGLGCFASGIGTC